MSHRVSRRVTMSWVGRSIERRGHQSVPIPHPDIAHNDWWDRWSVDLVRGHRWSIHWAVHIGRARNPWSKFRPIQIGKASPEAKAVARELRPDLSYADRARLVLALTECDDKRDLLKIVVGHGPAPSSAVVTNAEAWYLGHTLKHWLRDVVGRKPKAQEDELGALKWRLKRDTATAGEADQIVDGIRLMLHEMTAQRSVRKRNATAR